MLIRRTAEVGKALPRRRAGLVLAALLGAIVARPAGADETRFRNAGDAVPGRPGLTYADLVRQAVPGLQPSADGRRFEGRFATPPRHLAGDALQGEPSDPAVLGLIEDRRLLVGGKRRIALLADLGGKENRVEGLALLMLFDDEGKTPSLLDAADVGVDRDTAFASPGVLSLGGGESALVTWSEHGSAGLTMGGYLIVSPVGDRLALVGQVRLVSQRFCSWTAIETAHFTTVPDPGTALRRITARVTAQIGLTRQDGCNDEAHPTPATHVFQADWRWNPTRRRFEPIVSTLDGLEALNARLFR